jgi:hypothetical protein
MLAVPRPVVVSNPLGEMVNTAGLEDVHVALLVTETTELFDTRSAAASCLTEPTPNTTDGLVMDKDFGV